MGLEHLSYGHSLGGPDPLVSVCASRHLFFLVESMRFRWRHTTDQLTSSIFGVRVHASMTLYGSTSLQHAVSGQLRVPNGQLRFAMMMPAPSEAVVKCVLKSFSSLLRIIALSVGSILISD